jgi:hypothetical protein
MRTRVWFAAAAAILSSLVAQTPVSVAAEPAKICDLNVDILLVNSGCAYSATQILHVLSDPGPVFHYQVEPLCEAMDPGQSVCVKPAKCIDPPDSYRFVVLRWVDGSPPQQIGTVCFDDDQTEHLGVITEDTIIRRMRSLDWPGAELMVEPPGGRTLVNLPTNFYTKLVDPVVRSLEMMDHRVEVQATPTSYTWHFGDGSDPETGNDPGAPYRIDATLRVSHVYAEAEVTVTPSVDVTYSGAFRIDGGAWRPIPMTLTVAGTAVTLRVLTATPHLVG